MHKIIYPTSYIVWDLETNGFKAPENKILEIGLFKIENGVVVDTKRWVLNYGIEISAEITAINGMTKEIIDAEGRDPKVCLEEFLQYVRESKANLTHNGVRFDIPFLVDSVLGTLGETWTIERIEKLRSHLESTALDTAVFVKGGKLGMSRLWNESFKQYADRVMNTIARGVKYNVGICCQELGIDMSKATQHRALGDVEFTNEIFKALLK